VCSLLLLSRPAADDVQDVTRGAHAHALPHVLEVNDGHGQSACVCHQQVEQLHMRQNAVAFESYLIAVLVTEYAAVINACKEGSQSRDAGVKMHRRERENSAGC
jgi:hypothetical protein